MTVQTLRPVAAVSAQGRLPRTAGPCTECGRLCREVGNDGARYCDSCWEAWSQDAGLPADKAEAKPAPAEVRKCEREGAEAAAAEGAEAAAAEAEASRRQAAAAARAAQAAGGSGAPTYFVVGSWDDWTPREMVWNERRGCCHVTVHLGSAGSGSFQILPDGDWAGCLRPGSVDADSGESAALRGPAGGEEAETCWTIEGHQADRFRKGVCYEIRMRPASDGEPTVEWSRWGCPCAPSSRYWIAGTWDAWSAHPMNLDPVRGCFHYFVRLAEDGRASFQILAEGDPEARIYPEEEDGCFHRGHQVCGPDAGGEGLHWTIGAHALDRGAGGDWYEVCVRLKADGAVRDVNWSACRLGGETEDLADDALPAEGESSAMHRYGQRIAESGHDAILKAGAAAAAAAAAAQDPEPAAREEARKPAQAPLAPLTRSPRRAALQPCGADEDSDGEELLLCGHCGLPVGDVGYTRDGEEDALVHGECMAQIATSELRADDEARRREEAVLKQSKREEYSIGWSAARIPRSLRLARRLGCHPLPQGLCCLVYDEGSNSVRVAATHEPAASVNLAYLAIALQVRQREDREPLFSLDPVLTETKDASKWTQVKRFEPEWLAGTSLGETMFQADYYLKELSMGEYVQPVLGMRSCTDYAERDGLAKEWNAREWFVVRKAAIHLSADGVLIPHVKMGVEAREQIEGPSGLEDAPVTRKDHPLVLYAEEFTQKFELIAERRSAIYHVREVAKASILAKFLMEAKVDLDPAWFQPGSDEMAPCVTEIPQLWNERLYSRLRVRDGLLLGEESGRGPSMHGVYGGIELGLDRFPLTAAARPGVSAAAQFAALVRGPGQRRAFPLGVDETAQGVDLNLNAFALNSPIRVACEASEGSWGGRLQSDDTSAALGAGFWAAVDGARPAFGDEDRALLAAVFDPTLSDRRDDGGRFVPPDTSFSHVQKLRELVKEEELLRRRREERFLDGAFEPDAPGPDFPASWTSPIAVEAGGAGGAPRGAPPRAGAEDAAAAEEVVRCSAPVFDEAAEDGARFRIYRAFGLEVRTTQARAGREEELGAVFKVWDHPEGSSAPLLPVQEHNKVVAVSLRVERTPRGRRYYVTIETVQGNVLVTERLADGTLTWEENPAGLAERSAEARVLQAADCRSVGVTVGHMKKHRAAEGPAAGGSGASESASKRYGRSVLRWARGEPCRVDGASRERDSAGRWQQWSTAEWRSRFLA